MWYLLLNGVSTGLSPGLKFYPATNNIQLNIHKVCGNYQWGNFSEPRKAWLWKRVWRTVGFWESKPVSIFQFLHSFWRYRTRNIWRMQTPQLGYPKVKTTCQVVAFIHGHLCWSIHSGCDMYLEYLWAAWPRHVSNHFHSLMPLKIFYSSWCFSLIVKLLSLSYAFFNL